MAGEQRQEFRAATVVRIDGLTLLLAYAGGTTLVAFHHRPLGHRLRPRSLVGVHEGLNVLTIPPTAGEDGPTTVLNIDIRAGGLGPLPERAWSSHLWPASLVVSFITGEGAMTMRTDAQP